MKLRKTLRLLAMFSCVCASGASLAERPMTVDDAGTLDRGGAKVEFGWTKDDEARGWEAAMGFGLIEHVEVELGFGRIRDAAVTPKDTLRGTGAALKWVPLQSEIGLSAGLKFEYDDEDSKTEADARVRAINGLMTWAFQDGPSLHLNLGREWVSVSGGESESANTWGIGLDTPVTERLDFTIETFGANGSRPDRQAGVRYEVASGLTISGALGRGNGRTIANAGVAWEF